MITGLPRAYLTCGLACGLARGSRAPASTGSREPYLRIREHRASSSHAHDPMLRTRNLPLFLILAALLPGCFWSRSSTNEPLDPALVSQLVPGQSTASDVVGLLGAPTEVVQLGRRTAYRYNHTFEKQAALFMIVLGLRGVDTQEDRVWVFFDEDLVLTHVGSTFDAEKTTYSIPPWDSSADNLREQREKSE